MPPLSTPLLSLLLFLLLLTPTVTIAAPPAGHSALLNGMHDIQSSSWMKNATTGCDKGWITDLRYIGYGSSLPGVDCHTNETNAGISIIQRLDVSGSESYPRSTNNAAGFARNFAHYAKTCPNIHVWIVGNEPNFTEHKSDPDCTSPAYAAAYVAVHKAIHALPGHQNDVVLATPNSPYSPGCVESLRQIIKQIQQRGGKPDGFALHAYTRATRGSDLRTSHVTNTNTQNDQTRKECSGNAKWNDTWHSHFRIYMDYIKAIETLGLAGRPVYITESGNACEPTVSKNACYPDADIGYFQALYGEANRWNNLATTRTKIRAITPYRWTLNQDGTDRDFAIGKRPKLLADLTKAFGQKYRWTSDKCAPTPGCTADTDCPASDQCQAGKCVPRTPKTCQGAAACPGQLCSPSTCQDRPGQCIPTGDATFVFSPKAPLPGANRVQVVAQHSNGWTHIGLRYCGPTSGDGSFTTHQKIGKIHNWTFTFGPVQAGRYRIDFTADKGATIVGSTTLVVASPCTPQAEQCNNKDDDCDGKIDQGITRPCYEGPLGTDTQGTCKGGTTTCTAGQWGTCQGQVLPTLEVCDRLDNDCDGQVDNGCQPPPDGSSPLEPYPDQSNPDQSGRPDQSPLPETSAPPPEIPVVGGNDSNTPRFRSRGCNCNTSHQGTIPWLLLGLLLLLGAGGTRRRT